MYLVVCFYGNKIYIFEKPEIILFPKATRGFEPISCRRVLLSTLHHAIIYVFYTVGAIPTTYCSIADGMRLLLTRSVNTPLALCGAWSGASCCDWSAVGCGGSGRFVVKVGWRRCDGRATCSRSRLTVLRWPGDLWSKSADGAALETVGSVALHWGSLDGVCCSVEPDKAGGLIWPVPTKVFADLLLLVVTLRFTERASRTRELHCWRCMC
jgi:hypothetical protein